MTMPFPRRRFCFVMGIVLILPTLWLIDAGLYTGEDISEREKGASELYRRGENALAAKDFDLAIQYLSQTIDEYGRLVKDLSDRGSREFDHYWRLPFRLRGRELDRWAYDWEQAFFYRGKQAQAYLKRGQAYSAAGDHERAISDYTKAISWNRDWPEAYACRADSYRAIGDLVKAERDRREARELREELHEKSKERKETRRQ